MPPKEATVYIVDIGKTMGRKEYGREKTNLEWSMEYIWDRINSTVISAKKTEMLGVIALRSDKTNHALGDEDGYSNISVLQEIQQTLLHDMRNLKEQIKASKTSRGDILSAIIVAIHMIEQKCRNLMYNRKIVLVTDGLGSLDDDDVEQTISKIKSDKISLTVIGVDFDDAEYGFKEEDKDSLKERNEKVLQDMCEQCDGNYGTMAEAIAELGLPRLKQPHPTAIYKGMLTLGDPAKYDTAMSIAVERYAYLRIAKAPSASNFVVKSEVAAGSSTQTSATLQSGGEEHGDSSGLAAVKMARTYVVDDEMAPGGKRELERDELEKGYEYGRTAVPLPKEDESVTKLETWASFDIVGFVSSEDYAPWMSMSETNQVVASKVNQKAAMALSSLIHALHERDTYAVARLVPKDRKDPILVLLAPHMELGFECLIDVELPFAEDIRHFTFPPLNKVVTVGGKHITQHRNIPNDELMQAMSDYVDAMDISTFGKDDDGNPAEYAPIEDTYSLRKNYVEQAIKARALNPYDPPPPPYPILAKFSHPPEDLISKAQASIDAVIKAGNVKKVPPKQKGRKRGRDIEKPLSGLDVDSLLQGQKRIKISAENAIPEFKQVMERSEQLSEIEDAVKQLGKIILDLIKDSTGDLKYNRAAETLRVMKEEMVEMEEPGMYNEFLEELKEKLAKGELNGDRREMWRLIQISRLGLIDKGTSEVSKVTPEEAKAFFSLK